MCDQDHSEKHLLELEAEGKITRRQFGVMLGAGVAMILPLQRFEVPQVPLASEIHEPLAVVTVTAIVTRAKALCPAASVTRTV